MILWIFESVTRSTTLSTLLLLGLLSALGIASARRAARVRSRRRPARPNTRWTVRAKGPLLALLMLASLTPVDTRTELLARMSSKGDFWILLLLLLAPALTIYGLVRLPYVPWLLARHVAAPLGLPRVAYFLTRAGPLPWSSDLGGGAALAGALAVLHRDTHNPDAASWIEQRLAREPKLAAAGVIAYGLLAASRGDEPRARILLDSAFSMEPRDTPALARAIALDWLLADAAAMGEWRALHERATRHAKDLSPGSRLLAGAAARLLAEPSPHDVQLKLAWCLSPRRALGRTLLARALAEARLLSSSQRPAPAPSPTPPEPAPAEDPLEHALVHHLHWLVTDPAVLRAHPSRLVDLCAAWDAVFANEPLRARVAERAAALAAKGDPASHVARFRQIIHKDLALVAERAMVPLSALSRVEDPASVSREVAAELRRRLLEHVERLSSELGQRVDDSRTRAAIDEWSAWTELRRACAHAAVIGGIELRRLMFPQVHRDACAHAVWLWNKRDECAISMPMFHWLLAEAEVVEDEAAIELQRKNTNAKC
jgi:hypothetical protein